VEILKDILDEKERELNELQEENEFIKSVLEFFEEDSISNEIDLKREKSRLVEENAKLRDLLKLEKERKSLDFLVTRDWLERNSSLCKELCGLSFSVLVEEFDLVKNNLVQYNIFSKKMYCQQKKPGKKFPLVFLNFSACFFLS